MNEKAIQEVNQDWNQDVEQETNVRLCSPPGRRSTEDTKEAAWPQQDKLFVPSFLYKVTVVRVCVYLHPG